MSAFRDRIKAFMDPDTSRQEAEQELVQLRARVRRLEEQHKHLRRKPRGVVVTRLNAVDEVPEADRWSVERVNGGEDGWLVLRDVPGNPVATYKPGVWLHVEAGRLEDISEKAEEARERAPHQ